MENLQISILGFLHLEDDDEEDHTVPRVDNVFGLLLADLTSSNVVEEVGVNDAFRKVVDYFSCHKFVEKGKEGVYESGCRSSHQKILGLPFNAHVFDLLSR